MKLAMETQLPFAQISCDSRNSSYLDVSMVRTF
jgi:hypothetical protein